VFTCDWWDDVLLLVMDLCDFEPTSIGLRSSFFLTDYTQLKGCGCKLPRAELLDLLRDIGDGYIGMDSSVVPTRLPGIHLVQTTDL
jgi:selenide,water dikinase